MSRGSPIVPVRFAKAFLAGIDAEIRKVNRSRREVPYDRSSFLRAAVADKIAHLARSRRPKKQPAISELPPRPRLAA
jgi:hypothetical protein